jgi:hypothetical protein
MRIDENALLTAILAGALLAQQLGRKPPPVVRVIVTLATAVSFAMALRAAFPTAPAALPTTEKLIPSNPLPALPYPLPLQY